jgi:NAD+ synthase (glutamine-hydrolysing)
LIGEWVSDPLLGHFYFGSRQLFKIHELVMGVEICEDLWGPEPPSTALALAGANLIVNLSASNETVTKPAFRRELVDQQAGRLNVAYVYSAAHPSESTKDLVFGGHSIISENGNRLAEAKIFELDAQMVMADIDVQSLLHERMARNKTFGKTPFNRRDMPIHELSISAYLADLRRSYAQNPFVPSNAKERDERANFILEEQATGLAIRLKTSKAKTMVIGISGGLDSTLALLVAVKAAKKLGWDRSQIHGLTMPGFGTTAKTKSSAQNMAEALNITFKEISIKETTLSHFKDIEHNPNVHDLTYENAQARERTQILFDYANKHHGIVVGTGDLSELCLGWCTFNADHMSSYNVNGSVPKTLVKYLVRAYRDFQAEEGFKQVLTDVLETEISPELLPPSASGTIVQKTEEKLGPYQFHDFVIFHHLRNGFSPEKIYYLATKTFDGIYTPSQIHRWLTIFYDRFFKNQFKRTTLPPSPKIGSVSVSPRGDLRMPDEASCELFLKRLNHFASVYYGIQI